MEVEQERDEILKELRKIWFKKSPLFRKELLEFMDIIENKDFKECDFCKK